MSLSIRAVHQQQPDQASDPHQQAQLVWTRMQAEAGQGLEQIVKRKNVEREAGDGHFFWGVGNAPSRLIPELAKVGTTIPVFFSRMKSKPKAIDTHPASTVIWRNFIDHLGQVKPLPDYALITSRGGTGHRRKRFHFALHCFSEKELHLSEKPHAFKPTQYRNAGENGRKIGASQVTSLLVPSGKNETGSDSTYPIDFQAILAGSYWVKLTDPMELTCAELQLISKTPTAPSEWKALVRKLRTRCELQEKPEKQLRLL